jgi:hypothetical protein
MSEADQERIAELEAELARLRQAEHVHSKPVASPPDDSAPVTEQVVDADGVIRNIPVPTEVGSLVVWRPAKSELQKIQAEQQKALDRLWGVNRRFPRLRV